MSQIPITRHSIRLWYWPSINLYTHTHTHHTQTHSGELEICLTVVLWSPTHTHRCSFIHPSVMPYPFARIKFHSSKTKLNLYSVQTRLHILHIRPKNARRRNGGKRNKERAQKAEAYYILNRTAHMIHNVEDPSQLGKSVSHRLQTSNTGTNKQKPNWAVYKCARNSNAHSRTYWMYARTHFMCHWARVLVFPMRLIEGIGYFRLIRVDQMIRHGHSLTIICRTEKAS